MAPSDGGGTGDPALAELEWAIHAKKHARSRLAFKVFVKIIDQDDGTRDDIVYQAYVQKFQVPTSARATATQMLTRFHGAHEPYLLKARAEGKMYKLDEAFLSAFVGLGYCPIRTALISARTLPRTTLFIFGCLNCVRLAPVFVFDVDDTAVTSYWYMKERSFQAIPATEFYYYARYHAPPIPLLFKFYTYLQWKGIKIMFLTERPEVVRDHTLAMLHAAGYSIDTSQYVKHAVAGCTNADLPPRLIMRAPCEQMLSVAVLKQTMRRKLHRDNHIIVGCIGDQFCDITGELTGSPFKIPNYMYQME
ncbi:hypothetical protein DYB32_007626 [Aphanomyces invadans]|uniref:Uncharacterized protein n=1 Tax=Aphanomyces invadans TaxID=157072 RepID=A0A418ANB4_9STRA|nr:hypothetical protein DYB32_007626 [Aphanomyces invadans]